MPCAILGTRATGWAALHCALSTPENMGDEKREVIKWDRVIKWKIVVSASCDHERYSAVQFGAQV